MNTQFARTALAVSQRAIAKILPITFALLLGGILIGGTGFANISAVHNAAHDYRHSMGFPCH
jgi:cobalt transporter subunit CbtB